MTTKQSDLEDLPAITDPKEQLELREALAKKGYNPQEIERLIGIYADPTSDSEDSESTS